MRGGARTSALIAAVGVVVSALLGCECASFIENNKALRTALLTGYETEVRPTQSTVVSISMVVVSLNKLDTADQSMSLTVLWATEWTDARLGWIPASYGNTTFLIFRHNEVWVPPIVTVNEVNKVGQIGSGVPVRCLYSGKVIWIPPTSLETSCSISIANYPFDTQTCKVNITGWTYEMDELSLSLANDPISLVMYSSHGEWELVRSRAIEQNFIGVNNASKQSLEFALTFRRRWKYYGLTLLLPLALSSLLMPGVFAVPVESGEKIGYSLTVLLSFTVLLTLISESIPQISTQTSALQIYLTVVLNLSTLVTLLTIFILWLYHKEDQRPVTGLTLAVYRVLSPLACMGSKKGIIRVQPAAETDVITSSREKPTSLNLSGDVQRVRRTSAVSWQDFAKCIDAVCSRLFTGIFISLAVLFISYLYGNYYSTQIRLNL